MKHLVTLGLLVLIFTLACSLSPSLTGSDNQIATSVAETLAAQPPEPNQEENFYNTGDVEVSLCYPGEMIPPMTIYLENVNTQEVTPYFTIQNQPSVTLPVPEGTYIAYAWLPDLAGAGSYSQAVTCGLTVDCTDHSLIEFQVVKDQTAPGIEICDWYGTGAEIPFPPGVDLSLYFGSISGILGYPSESIPPMTVVATNTATQQIYFVETAFNQGSYIIENLPSGQYTVVAYPQGDEQGGGFSEFVPCGQSVDCSDHSLIPVTVTTGQETSGVDPVDFYAGPGTFPENPAN